MTVHKYQINELEKGGQGSGRKPGYGQKLPPDLSYMRKKRQVESHPSYNEKEYKKLRNEGFSANEIMTQWDADKKKTYADLKEEFRNTSAKIDDIVESGGKVGLNNPLSIKLKKLQNEMNKQPD